MPNNAIHNARIQFTITEFPEKMKNSPNTNKVQSMSVFHSMWSRQMLVAATLGTSFSCVCPPCEAPGAQGAKPAAVVPVGSRLVVWDGEGGGIEGGKSWADCDKKGACKATLAPAPKLGKDSTNGLKFHAEGEGWQGAGWNWFGWWPETAGTDFRPYTHLTLWIKVTPKTPELAPEPGALGFLFGCSAGKKSSGSVVLGKYDKNLFDGQWHKVTVPLADFYVGKEGAEFDPGTAWEFRLNHWAGAPRNFDVILDDVAVEKQ